MGKLAAREGLVERARSPICQRSCRRLNEPEAPGRTATRRSPFVKIRSIRGFKKTFIMDRSNLSRSGAGHTRRHPTAPEARALPETGRYSATFQNSESKRLLL